MSDFQKSVDQWLDGETTPAAHARLNECLRNSPQDVREFAEQVVLHSLLHELHRRESNMGSAIRANPPSNAVPVVGPSNSWSRARVISCAGVGLVLSVLMSIGLFTLWGGSSSSSLPDGVAALIDPESTAVEAAGFSKGRIYPGARLRFSRGQMVLRFGDHASVTVTGDADLEVQSPRRAILHRGQVTATVTEAGRGFTIATPRADVVDLGTRFGISVRPDDSEDIVVFDGEVNVHDEATASRSESPPRRLLAGEAIRLQDSGTPTRIPLVWQQSSRSGLIWSTASTPDASSPISRVTDNLSTGSRPKFYAVSTAGFVENARAHVDRPYVWTGPDDGSLPSELREGDYIQTFCDDKIRKNLQITVGLSAPSHVYILFDSRIPELPTWLTSGFRLTDLEVALKGDVVGFFKRRNRTGAVRSPASSDSGQEDAPRKPELFRFNVWRRDVKTAGEIRLGPVSVTPSQLHSMYGIVVVRAETGGVDRSR